VANRSNASLLRPGSIVKIENPISSSGRPTYAHYFIVLSIPEPLEVGSIIPLVGVSKIIDPAAADPAKHVQMKWLNRKGGDPQTGFNTRCYACADFTHFLEVQKGTSFPFEVQAAYEGRFIQGDRLQTVVAMMNALARKSQLQGD
jgi:hypothetical protein